MAWTSIVLVLLGWTTWRLTHLNRPEEWLFKLLRRLLHLTSTVCFIPVLHVLLRALSCGDSQSPNWHGTNMGCGGAAHVIFLTASTTCLVMFLAVALASAALLVDRNCQAPGATSQVHGRKDAMLLGMTFLLCLVLHDALPLHHATWLAVLLCLGCAALWATSMCVYLPYMLPQMNQLHSGACVRARAARCWLASVGLTCRTLLRAAGFAAGFAWTAFTTLIAHAKDSPSGWGSTLWAGVAASFATGWSLCRLRQDQIAAKPLRRLASVHDYHCWVSCVLARRASVTSMDAAAVTEVMQLHRDYAFEPAQDGGRDDVAAAQSAPRPAVTTAAVTARGRRGSFSGLDDTPRTSRAQPMALPTAQPATPLPASGGGGDALKGGAVGIEYFEQLNQSKERLQLALLTRAETAFRRLTQSLAHSSMGMVMAAEFYKHFHTNHYLEILSLGKASRLTAALDISFFVQLRMHELREQQLTQPAGSADGTTTKAALTGVDRAVFDQQWQEVQRLYKKAYRSLVSVWDVLHDARPDLRQLLETGRRLQRVLTRMQALFDSLVLINPDSVAVLRAYADFLLNLANNPQQANELVNRADRLDEVQSSAGLVNVQHFRVLDVTNDQLNALDDSAATLTVNTDPRALGEVLAVSASYCRMFGYTRAQLLGQDVSVCLPTVIRHAHKLWMRDFTVTGRGRLLNRTSALLGQARDGTLIPLQMTLKEVPPAPDSIIPLIMGIIRRVSTQERILMVADAEGGYRVVGACASTMRALGIGQDAVAAGTLSALSWFPALEPGYSETVRVDNAAVHALAANHTPRAAGMVLNLACLSVPPMDTPKLTKLHAAGESMPFAEVRVQDVTLKYMEPVLLVRWRPVDVNQLLNGIDHHCRGSTARVSRAPGWSQPPQPPQLVSSASAAAPVPPLLPAAGSHGTQPPLPLRIRAPVALSAAPLPCGLEVMAAATGMPAEQGTPFHAALPSPLPSPMHTPSVPPSPFAGGFRTSSPPLMREGTAVPDSAAEADVARSGSTQSLDPALFLNGATMADADLTSGSALPASDFGDGGGTARHDVTEFKQASTVTPAAPAAGGRALVDLEDGMAMGGPHMLSLSQLPRKLSQGEVVKGDSAPSPLRKQKEVPSPGLGYSRSRGTKSMGSRTSTANAMVQLRRILFGASAATEPEIRTMHITLLATSVAVIAIAVGVSLATAAARDALIVRLRSLQLGGERLAFMQAARTNVFRMEDILQSTRSTEELPALVLDLNRQVGALYAAHTEVAAIDLDLRGHAWAFCTTPTLPVLQRGLEGTSTIMMPPSQAAKYVVSQLRAMARHATSVEELQASAYFMEAVTMNFDAAQEAISTSTHARLLDLYEYVSAYRTWQLVLFLAAFVVMVFICGALFVRGISALKERTDDVLKIFLHVPRPALKAARQHAMSSYEHSLHRELEQEGTAQAERPDGKGVERGGDGEQHDSPDLEDGVDWESFVRQKLGPGAGLMGAGRTEPSEPLFRDSSKFVVQNVVRLLLPLTVVCIWGIVLYFSSSAATLAAQQDALRMAFSSYNNAMCGAGVVGLQELPHARTALERQRLVETVDFAMRQVQYISDLTVNGGMVPPLHPVYGRQLELAPLPEGSLIHRALTENACHLHSNVTECEEFADGIFLHGLHSALLELSALARQTAFSVPLDVPAANETLPTFVMEVITASRRAQDWFLREMLSRLSQAFRDDATRVIEADGDQTVATSSVFAVTFSLFTVLFYWRSVSRLSDGLNCARSMLLAIPEPVALHVSAIWDGIRQVVQEGDASSRVRRAQSLHRRASKGRRRAWLAACLRRLRCRRVARVAAAR